MARRLLDADFRVWEAFLNLPPHGEGASLQVVFRCVSDPSIPSRAASATDRATASVFLREASDADCLGMLEAARPLS